MHLTISPAGTAHCIYGQAIDLAALGTLTIQRASNVEPDDVGQWWADLAPVGGPILGPFPPNARSAALAAEVEWLTANGY